MFNFQPIFAVDWESVIGILFFVLYGVGQLLGNRQEAKAKQKPKPPRPPQPPRQEPIAVDLAEPVAAKPRNQEEALRSEIEDFLRRAQGKPPKPKPEPERRRPEPRPELDFPQRPQYQPSQQRKSRPVPTSPAPPRKSLRPLQQDSAAQMRQESVGEHVTRHLSTSDIAVHAEALGDELELTDERLEERLKAKFEHELGSLGQREEQRVKQTAKQDMAAEISAMLRSPAGMRQLIIANEILRRPEI